MLYLAENQVPNLRQASLIASYTEKCSSNISIRKCYFLDLEKLKRLKETKFPIYQMNHPIPGSQPSLAKLFHSPITAIFEIFHPPFMKEHLDCDTFAHSVFTVSKILNNFLLDSFIVH